ncbi:MAG: hypothetical protein HYZ74_08065 [Elusimicrobia bacterium]|nr:hypothetical protein [Elusimicrobiota bacterium]
MRTFTRRYQTLAVAALFVLSSKAAAFDFDGDWKIGEFTVSLGGYPQTPAEKKPAAPARVPAASEPLAPKEARSRPSFGRYSRHDLEDMPRSELIDLVIMLQGGAPPIAAVPTMECKTYDPTADDAPVTVLTRYRHPSYADDGALLYPDGKMFRQRHHGYADDGAMFYPNGKALIRRNAGYADDNTIYWPTGNTFILKHPGYADNGTVYRADGSVWLQRNAGYSNDRVRNGLPIERGVTQDGVAYESRLADDGSATLKVTMDKPDWIIVIEVKGSDSSVRVTECLKL